jgi:hypothetical protein
MAKRGLNHFRGNLLPRPYYKVSDDRPHLSRGFLGQLIITLSSQFFDFLVEYFNNVEVKSLNVLRTISRDCEMVNVSMFSLFRQTLHLIDVDRKGIESEKIGHALSTPPLPNQF